MATERFFSELPAYVQEVIECSNYAFDYAMEHEEHYSLYTESGYCFEVVQKR